MNRKTVLFKMPAADAPRRDEANSDPAAPIDAQSPAHALDVAGPSEIPDASVPERWVRMRDLDPAPDFAAAAFRPPPPGAAAGWSANFDLAAERNFSQIVALSLALPSALGWFWAANAFDRYRRIFA